MLTISPIQNNLIEPDFKRLPRHGKSLGISGISP
jgi:hypothetical protein